MVAKLKILSLVCLAAIAAVAHAQSEVWVANAQDKTISALVERWAQSEGQHAKWEAVVDFPILDPDGLNLAAKLSGASSMTNAVDRLLKMLSKSDSSSYDMPGPKDIGYFACLFDTGDVALVIRSHGQADCSKPL